MVRIGADDYALQEWLGREHAVIARDKRGGFLLAEVVAVHTHECVRRRWGRKNHHKQCNCGADELFSLAQANDSMTWQESKETQP